MAKPADPPRSKPGEISVSAEQLRPGVHVRLPVHWLDHQFLFNSFVIETDEQVREIAEMKLPTIYCDVSRCRVPPLPPGGGRKIAPESRADHERREAQKAAQLAAKHERIKAMDEIRGHLEHTYKHYVGANKTVSSAISGFDIDPQKAMTDIHEVSHRSTSLLLSDLDSAIVLIAEKGQSDGASAHALSVMTLSLLLGKQSGLPEEGLRLLGSAALLHDIGKSTLNPSILKNPERNRHEEAVYQSHCALGHAAVQKLGRVPNALLEVILHHHEHFDGTGFPSHQRGDQIHIAARVVAVADRFDSLVNPINYRTALSPSEALSRMWAKESGHFDPVLLQLFIKSMGVYPPGTIVQLDDGRIGAVVVSAEADNLLRPQVMLYDPDVPRSEALIIDLAKELSVKIDRAVRLQDRPEDELDYLLPRRRMAWFASEG